MRIYLSCFLLLVSCGQSEVVSDMKNEVVGETQYRYYIVNHDAVRVLWKDEHGQPIKTFQNLQKYCERNRINHFAAMNGGIFEPDRRPTGLLIQDKKELTPLNLNEGKGNFFLKPNGVFYITKDKAKITDSKFYNKEAEKLEIHYATQSGPLLVLDGKIHPAFNKDSTSRKLRNGVGILENGKILLAISMSDAESPNLYEFASFFLSKGCKNALYLDGSISEFRKGDDRAKEVREFSSFILIEE